MSITAKIELDLEKLSNCCRLCLSNGTFYSITNKRVETILKDLNFELTDKQLLSNGICRKCFAKLRRFHLFVKGCQKNVEFLNALVEED